MDGKPAAWEVEVTLCDEPALPIPVLWARERIRDLEGKISRRDTHQREGEADEVRDFLKQKVIAVSRTYGLLSQETDFVAVEERAEADKTIGEVVVRKVPSLVTAGWHGINVLRDVSVSFCHSAMTVSEPRHYVSAEIQGYGSEGIARMVMESKPIRFASLKKGYDRIGGDVSTIGQDEDDIILTVLKQQQVAGGFLLDQVTAKLLELDLQELAKLAGKITTSGEVDRLLLLSTALVLHILETRYADRRSLWEGMVKKSVAWLRDQLARTNPALEGRELKAWVVDFLK
jgi:hypothetical protein